MGNTSIHQLVVGELDLVDEVIVAAYGLEQGRKSTLQRYLALQPDGAFVAEQDGSVVGFGAAIQYATFAYIGLMAVHPTVQKQGIGHLLLEHILDWLDTSGCPTVLLDATPAGAPLYERSGFVEDDITVVLRYDQGQIDATDRGSGKQDEIGIYDSVTVLGLNGEELPALFAYDAHYFGSERVTVLASYWVDDPQRVLVIRNAEAQLTGYLLAQSGTLGPWVADTKEDAERLLVSALAFAFQKGPDVFVSAANEDALALLERYGFSEQRRLRHMRRGEKVQRGRTTAIYGQASLGFG